jgi:hypothetical protein
MHYKEVKKLSPAEFKRFCGVHPETFEQMVKVATVEKMLQKKPGRPSKLSIEDRHINDSGLLARISDLFSFGD